VDLPANFDELEAQAHAAMPRSRCPNVAGGCGNEHTQNVNVNAFERCGLVARMLVGAAKRESICLECRRRRRSS